MLSPLSSASAADARDLTRAGSARHRAPYVMPTLERLGRWSALTLQQSVPVSLLPDPELSGGWHV